MRVDNQMKQAYAWKIGNGSIPTSSTNWVQGKCPEVKDHINLRQSALAQVSDFLSPNPLQWNRLAIFRFFQPSVANQIIQMELLVNPSSDEIYWKLHKTGNYCVKSGYSFFLALNSDACDQGSQTDKFFKFLWAMSIMPKWKVFLWKILHNGLPLSSALIMRHIQVTDMCPLCGQEPETYQHLFRLCPLVQRVWASSSLGIRSTTNLSRPFHHWVKEFLILFIEQDGHSGSRLLTFVGILWEIWISKNNAIFRNDQVTNPSILHHIQQSASTRTTHTTFQKSDSYQIPTKPPDTPPGFLLAHIGQRKDNISQPILLVDGSWSPIDNNAGSAWVLSASLARGRAFFSKITSAFQTEALPLLHGLIWANNIGFSDLLVYTNSSLLILGLQ
ncbi:hypothetical protein RDABS01_022491 [Bienertia sinuspersici]